MARLIQWRCVGEYGIQEGEFICKVLEAYTPQGARERFADILKDEYPVQWARIGNHNITIEVMEDA